MHCVFDGSKRHELDKHFLEKFVSSFDEEELLAMVRHLDRFPSDGDTLFEKIPEFRVIVWKSKGVCREVFYLYRACTCTIVYIECCALDIGNADRFKKIDPVQMLKIGNTLVDLIEGIFDIFFRSPERGSVGLETGGRFGGKP